VHAPTLDGCGERAHLVRRGITVRTHAREVAQLLFYEDLTDVVLAGTSSGGMVIQKAAELARERVRRVVFVDALALLPGERVDDIVKRSTPNDVTELTTMPTAADVESRLFRDLDPTTRAWAVARITPHPLAALEAPMEPTTFWEQSWRATVIRCRRATNPPEAHQRRTAERLGATWHELDTGHYPMLSEPEALTRLLRHAELEAIAAALQRATGAARVTLRLDVPRAGLSVADVTAEALAPGAASLRGQTSIDQRAAGSIRWLEQHRRALVQEDVTRAEAPPPPELVRVYGATAQMLGPVIRDGALVGWLSVHHAGGPRRWSAADVAALEAAVGDVQRELDTPA
jgi:alpha/beta hydrolase family protein/GAF domain-containing protein